MCPLNIVIVGSGIGGAAAAWDAVRFIPDVKVKLIGDEDIYMRHKIRYVAHGLDISFDTSHLESNGVEIIKDRAVKIDRNGKSLVTERSGEISYDYLILATGAEPSKPRVPGAEFTRGFRRKEDVEYLAKEKPQKVAIIGASYVALHAAQTCKDLGLVPYVIVRSRLIRKSLEPELSEELERRLKERGVQFVYGKLQKVEEDGPVVDERKVKADLIISAIGVKPNSELAKEAGLELWWDNVKVDQQGRTSDPKIFAIGDVSNCYDPITKKIDYFGLGTIATIMAYNSINAIKGSKGALRTPRYQKDVFFKEIFVKSIGFTSPEAEKAGFTPERKELRREGDEEIAYIVYDKPTGRVIGYSSLSKRDSGYKDLLILKAVLRGMKIQEVLEFIQS